MTKLLIIIYFLLNLATFIVYGLDKHKAKRAKWRVPEATLLLLAAIGGSVGALVAMVIFNHKTRKRLFNFGVPVILILQVIAAAYLLL